MCLLNSRHPRSIPLASPLLLTGEMDRGENPSMTPISPEQIISLWIGPDGVPRSARY